MPTLTVEHTYTLADECTTLAELAIVWRVRHHLLGIGPAIPEWSNPLQEELLVPDQENCNEHI